MYGVNEVILIGDVNKEPTSKFTPSNLLIGNLILTVKRPYYNKDGEKQLDVQDVIIDFFSKVAERMMEEIHMGARVFVKCRMRGRTYEGKHYVNLAAYDFVRLTEGTIGKLPETHTEPDEAPKDDEDDLPL